MQDKEKKCTLSELNFSFNYNEDCSTCEDGECHAQVVTSDGHYQIHVLGVSRIGPFRVTIYDLQTDAEAVTKEFAADSDCATYLRDNFGFKCE